MFDIMYNHSEEVSPFLLMDGIYTIIFIISTSLVTGLFLWGLFGKKPELIRKIIGIELMLLFLLTLIQFANDSFSEISMFLYAGMNARILIMALSSCFYKVGILCSVSLYKLILVLVLSIKVSVKRKNQPNQQVDPIVTTPVDEVKAQSTQGHP